MNLTIRLTMHEHGWASLIIRYDQREVNVDLSDVFDPFRELVEWGYIIQKNILPASITINEERHLIMLDATYSSSEDQFHLLATGSYMNQVYMDINLNRLSFCNLLKKEIIRFFKDEFNEQHWDSYYEKQDINPFSLKSWVLSHSWILDKGVNQNIDLEIE